MPLCGSVRTCSCSLTSTSLQISGDGSGGTPWTIESTAGGVGTRAQRLALSGPDLFEGRQFWEQVNQELWIYSVNRGEWELIGDVRPTTLQGFTGVAGVTGRLRIQGDTQNIVLDASSNGFITYPVGFASQPTGWVQGGDPSVPIQVTLSFFPSASGMNFTVRSAAGATMPSATVRVVWGAIGMVNA